MASIPSGALGCGRAWRYADRPTSPQEPPALQLPRSHPACSWIPTPGHTPGHVSYLHQPSGTLLAGDAVFNVLPSLEWASGIEALVTRPLRYFAGPAARLAMRPAHALLGGLLGGGGGGSHLPAAAAALGSERLTSGVVSRGLLCDCSCSCWPEHCRTQDAGSSQCSLMLPALPHHAMPFPTPPYRWRCSRAQATRCRRASCRRARVWARCGRVRLQLMAWAGRRLADRC